MRQSAPPWLRGASLRDADPEAEFRGELILAWAELPGGRTGLTAGQAIELVRKDKEKFLSITGAPQGTPRC